jgi:hypothetical protein
VDGWLGLNSKGKSNMSPQAGVVLMQEIAPRLRNAIPQCVRKVGAEDDEELLQDGLTMAAQMLDNLEERGKQVTPGNVAYYCLLHLKSGRRSYSGGRTDVMGSATQLDHSSMVLSFEEEVGYDPELDEAIRLGDMLTCSKDDPSMAGASLPLHAPHALVPSPCDSPAWRGGGRAGAGSGGLLGRA